MQVEIRPNPSFMKYEPTLIDDFEIRRVSGCGEPTVLDSDSAAPPINGVVDIPSTESDGSPIAFPNGFKQRDRRAYQPGISLNLPLSVISCLKNYVGRLETAQGRYICISALNSCLESFANFDEFCAHLRASHSPCRRYRCLYCGLSTPFNEVKSHIDLHFDMSLQISNRYPCPYCFEKITRKCKLVSHIEQEHKESLLKYPFCRVCSEPFKDPNDYCLHVERSSFDLYHCPDPKCYVKSPDKMLVVEHFNRKHEKSDQPLAVHFRSTRHFSCAADVDSMLEKLRPVPSQRTSTSSCSTTPEEQQVPVLLLECPVCEKAISDKFYKFVAHAAKCNRFADGEEVEMCPEESEVQLQLFSCSACGATATKKSIVQVHLRSGRCCGLQGRILSENVSIERLTPSGTTARRRPRSMQPPQPPTILPAPISPSIRLPIDSPTASVSTEGTVPGLKEEPAVLDNLLGWARVNMEVGALMRFPEVLACRTTYSNVRQMTGEVKKLSIALYGFGAGTESRFLCPTCSSSFPGHEDEHLRFGRHVVEHHDLPPNIVDLCMKVLKIDIDYINKQSEVRRDATATAAMVIKDEPAPPVSPSRQEQMASATLPTAPPSDDGDPASPMAPAEAEGDDVPLASLRPERSYITLKVSPPVLEQVVTMLPSPINDGPIFRVCIERYLTQRIFERGRRFFCETCIEVTQAPGFTSFSELRRHLIRKHCKLPEHLTVFCLLLVRQQMMGSYELLPDALQMRVLALPGVQQTQISYRLAQYVKQREDADKRMPPMEDIIKHVERLCDGNSAAKRKSATLGRLTPSAAPEKSSSVQGPAAKKGEKAKETGNTAKEEGKEENPKDFGESEEAEVTFDFDKFVSVASSFKMDVASQLAVKRKMSGLKAAKITCRRIRADRISFKCSCGKYEELVQNVSVTDGPRRHALRAHVRISKVHWSVCLQCTSLEFSKMAGPISANQKRAASPQLIPVITLNAKRSRVETEEADSPALTVCGFKMRVVDERQPLAYIEEAMSSGTKTYCGFTISGVPWHPLTEAKQQLKTDAHADVLRRRLVLLPEYRVYTLQGTSRSFVCSACGFASDYTSRDVKRHLLVLHLGINVELVTSILNFAETRSFPMDRHGCTVKDLVGSERWAGCAEPETEAEADAAVTSQSGGAAVHLGRNKSRKRLVPRLPAIARKTTKKGPSLESPPVPPAANAPEKEKEKEKEKEAEAAKEARLQPFVRLVRLSPKEIATGRLERPISPPPFTPAAAPDVTPAASPEKKSEAPSGSGRKVLSVLRVQRAGGDVVFRCSLCAEERSNKVDLIAHMSRVHANLNQSWRFGCKACGSRFTGMTMYKAHVDAKHLGAPVLLNRLLNKDWQAEFPVINVEEN